MGCRSWPVHRVFAPADAGQNRIRVTEKQILEEEGQVSKITPKQEKKVEMDIIRVEIRYTPERQEGSGTDAFCQEYWQHSLVKSMGQSEESQELENRKLWK